jgi:hypothetical protein
MYARFAVPDERQLGDRRERLRERTRRGLLGFYFCSGCLTTVVWPVSISRTVTSA